MTKEYKTKKSKSHKDRIQLATSERVSASRQTSASDSESAHTATLFVLLNLFVLVRLGKKGVLSFSEAARFVEEFAYRVQNPTEEALKYFLLIITALRSRDKNARRKRSAEFGRGGSLRKFARNVSS